MPQDTERTKDFKQFIESLKEIGVRVEPGLTDEEIATLERAVGGKLPPDLKAFYKIGFPVGEPMGNKGMPLPDWRRYPETVATEKRRLIEELFIWDMEKNNYWHEALGPRPSDIAKAKHIP